MKDNPIKHFHIDKLEIKSIGHDLQRPECILAEPDGTLWAADARGGVMHIKSDGTQELITQKRSNDFAKSVSDVIDILKVLCQMDWLLQITATY